MFEPKRTIIKARKYGNRGDTLTEKLRSLESFQTPRTAKEFFDFIEGLFTETKARLPRGFLSDMEYQLQFEEKPDALFILYKEPDGTDTATYFNEKEKQEIMVTTRYAFTIPGLQKDTLLGRNDSLDKMPTGIRINNQTYELHYNSSDQERLRGKLS